MDLILFSVFLALSLALVALGLFRGQEHTELALVGFVFLFLLAMLIIAGDIQYKTGEQTNTTYTYNNSTLTFTQENKIDVYGAFTASGAFSHTFGYWMAIASIVGFIAVLVGLRGQRF